MHLKINELEVNTQSRTLSINGQKTALSDKEFELILMFIESNGSPITKDQILERVWKTQHRSDSSVKKLISQLRKKINDNVEEPVYIKTLGRQGYQWVASTKPTDSSHETESIVTNLKKQKLTKLVTAIGFAAAAIVITFLLLNLNSNNSATNATTDIRNLYLEKVDLPSSNIYKVSKSPDGKFIAFTQLKGKEPKNSGSQWNRDLILYNTSTKQVHKIIKDASLGSWSPDSSKFAYVDGSEGNCQFKIISIDDSRISSLNHCGSFISQPSVVWGKSDNLVYQFYNELPDSQMKLFKTDIETGVTEEVLSPKELGFGLYYGVFGKDKDKLYILESVNFNHTSIIEYSFTTQEYRPIHNIPYIIWDMASYDNGIVYRNEFNGLNKLDLKTGKVETLLSSQVTKLQGVVSSSSGELLVHAGFNFNVQLLKYNNEEFSYSFITHGSIDQYPLYKNEKLYFASQRTLSTQIYQYEDGHLLKLTDFNRKLLNPLSYDIDENENVIISSAQGIFINDKKLRDTGQCVHYHNRSIYFSDKAENRFEIFKMDIDTKKVERLTFSGGYTAKFINDELYFTKANMKGIWKLDSSGNEVLINSEFPIVKSMGWFYIADEIWAADLETSLLYKLHLPSNTLYKSENTLSGVMIAGDGKNLYGTETALATSNIYTLKEPR